MEEKEQVHKRRVRYSGTHPKTFKEKYKEQNPEKYADTIEKVIRKGSTPAGMHISICVNEILEFLNIQPGQKGLDATLGYGGHTQEMLKCLEGKGHMYALDALVSGGRVAILTFHSGEDRLVKKAFKRGKKMGKMKVKNEQLQLFSDILI